MKDSCRYLDRNRQTTALFRDVGMTWWLEQAGELEKTLGVG